MPMKEENSKLDTKLRMVMAVSQAGTMATPNKGQRTMPSIRQRYLYTALAAIWWRYIKHRQLHLLRQAAIFLNYIDKIVSIHAGKL
jgi:hypothetical protein